MFGEEKKQPGDSQSSNRNRSGSSSFPRKPQFKRASQSSSSSASSSSSSGSSSSSTHSSFFDPKRGSLSFETFLHGSEFVSLWSKTGAHLTLYPGLCKRIKDKELAVISQEEFRVLKNLYVTRAKSEHKYLLMVQIKIILVEHIELAYEAYKKTYQKELEMPLPQSEKDKLLDYFEVAIRFVVDNPTFGKSTESDYWTDDFIDQISKEELAKFKVKKAEQLADRTSFAISKFQYENLPASIKEYIQNVDAYKDLIAKLGDCFLQQHNKLIEFQKDESKASDDNNFPYIAETSLKDYVFHNIQDACQATNPKTDAVKVKNEVEKQLEALLQKIAQAIIAMIRDKKGNSSAADSKETIYYIKKDCLDSFLKEILFSGEKKDWLSSEEEIKKKQDELTKTIKAAFGLFFTNESDRRLSQVSRVASTSMPYLPPLLPSVNKI